jgi:hypothetical protein
MTVGGNAAGATDGRIDPVRFGHVLLPLDGSSFSIAALPTARDHRRSHA